MLFSGLPERDLDIGVAGPRPASVRAKWELSGQPLALDKKQSNPSEITPGNQVVLEIPCVRTRCPSASGWSPPLAPRPSPSRTVAPPARRRPSTSSWYGLRSPAVPLQKFIIFNTQFLVFNTQFLVFNTKFLAFNAQSIICTHAAGSQRPP